MRFEQSAQNNRKFERSNNKLEANMSHKVFVILLVVAFVATVFASQKQECKQPAPPKCGKNEVLSKCKPTCEATCSNPTPNPKICTKVKKCTVGCVCQKGLLRNIAGKCVQPCDCKKK